MADLLSSNVTTIASWTNGNTNGRRNKVKRIKYTGTTAGGTSNKLLASAMGFTAILNCSPVLLDGTTKKIYPAVPAASGAYILLFDPDQATDANRATAADLATSTDYAYVTVEGY